MSNAVVLSNQWRQLLGVVFRDLVTIRTETRYVANVFAPLPLCVFFNPCRIREWPFSPLLMWIFQHYSVKRTRLEVSCHAGFFFFQLLPSNVAKLATLEGSSCIAPEDVVTVLCTADDGCGWHPKHIEWTCRIINRLLCVASHWTIINIFWPQLHRVGESVCCQDCAFTSDNIC